VDSEPRGPEERATFIVRLAKAASGRWHGVVELVDRRRRRHVAGPEELADFIDAAFAEPSRIRPPDRSEPPLGGPRWH
jgi:hypothetical protein